MARTEARSIAAGNAKRRQDCPPSVVRRTRPARPTSQQTDGAGEEPADGVSPAPIACVCQDAPPSAECWTSPPAAIRHWLARSDDTIVALADVSILALSAIAAARGEAAGAGGDPDAATERSLSSRASSPRFETSVISL